MSWRLFTVLSSDMGLRIQWDHIEGACDEHLACVRYPPTANCWFYLSFALNHVQNTPSEILRIGNTDETHTFSLLDTYRGATFCRSLSRCGAASRSSPLGMQSSRSLSQSVLRIPCEGF